MHHSAGAVYSTTANTVHELIALSDERDLWLRRVLAAERNGFARGAASMAGEYDRGFADGVAAYKKAQHDAHRCLTDDLARWDGLRERFADPRDGDYVPGAAA